MVDTEPAVNDGSLRVVIAPDSFKGTVSASDAAAHLARGWSSVRPHDDLVLLPTADGGEGTIDAIAKVRPGSVRGTVTVTGPDRRPVAADWLLLPDGTAVVEAAQTSGLPLMRHADATAATSLGLGELLRTVVATTGVRRALVGLGGTACTDGGAGALVALGALLLDHDGRPIEPSGAGLAHLAQIELEALINPPLDGVRCLVDVTAPLLGPLGAARQFAPQKGATPGEVDLLDHALTHWSTILGGTPATPGSGAAGGLAYGLQSAWGAQLEDGSRTIAAIIGLPGAVASADLVLTGEGRFDEQSLRGKVVGHIVELAGRHAIPVTVVAGSADGAPRGSHELIELCQLSGSVAAAMQDPATWLPAAGALAASRLVRNDL